MRFLLLCFLIFTFLGISKAQNFSDSLRISLVTGSSGDDLYAQFGHSAIRVQDLKHGQDILFNYGTFDFDTPNFYWKFVRGKLEYVLSVGYTSQMIPYYEQTARSLINQEIPLDSTQQQRVLQFLLYNYQPENRGYLYNFFFDNCATRIRDVLENELTAQLQYPQEDTMTITFRQLLDVYISKSPWIDFGIDLILGLPADQIADIREQMYLPEFLANNLTQFAKLNGKPLLEAPTELTSGVARQKSSTPKRITPVMVFSLLLVLYLLITWRTNPIWKLWMDYLLFFTVGVAGSVILFLWIGTDHDATKENLNILWANPLYLLAIPFLKYKANIASKILFSAMLVGVATILVGWFLLPQQFHVALIPILLTLIVRLLSRLNLLPKA
jgi:hypothetical protein